MTTDATYLTPCPPECDRQHAEYEMHNARLAARPGESLPPLPQSAYPAHAQPIPPHATEIPEGRHRAPVCPEPPSEVLMSLNGFDEIAIAAHYGQRVGEMREADAITTGRALAFVWFRRQGQRDKDAHEASMRLTMREVVEFFAPEPTPDDAASAEGNDG